MISRTSVFRKSIKGAEAIATRQPGMPHRLRSALIMIDGKRSVEELAGLVSILGEPEALIAELEVAGLIELAQDVVVGSAPQALDSSAAKQGAMAPSAGGSMPLTVATLAGAQRFASRLLLELLGPTSEALCLKIEAARDLPAFVSAVMRARDVLRDVKGREAAVHFVEQVEAHTPIA